MAREDVQQHEVLQAVVAYLRSSLGLDDRTCFETLNAAEAPAMWMGTADNWQLLVSPGPGAFDAGLFHGGGREQTMEVWQIVVGIYTQVSLDETGHDHEALVKANRGILRLKYLVLNALSGRDLTPDGEEGSPDTDVVFLRETIRPVSASQPVYLEQPRREGDEPHGPGLVQLLLGFSVPFDWELV